MKSTAVVLMASLLVELLAPCISYASGQLQDQTVHRGNRPGYVQDRATIVAERAIRLLYGLDVRTMSRGRLDVSKLRTGLIAHVVHTSAGSKSSASGTIARIGEDGIALWDSERPAERMEIPYADIDTLVVAGDRRALERWQRRAEGRFLVMSRSNLDLAKLITGWYALVVFRVGDGTRVELTEVRDTVDGHVVFGPPYKAVGKYWAKRKIARDDIEIIVVSDNWEDITEWRHATQVIPHLIENPRIRFNASGIAGSESNAKSVIGHLVDVNQDSFVVSAGLSRNDVFKLPLSSFTDFQINLGRRRNAGKGFLIGGGVVFLVSILSVVAKGGKTSKIDPAVGGYTMLMLVSPAMIGSAIGYFVETDRWVDWDKLSPSRLDLTVAPTRSRGFGAAVSFNF